MSGNNKIVDEILAETKAYADLDEPVILASGELGIYYVNTEKILMDDGKFEDYGDDADMMIEHCLIIEQDNILFRKVIDILSAQVSDKIPVNDDLYCISGGQRRDWIFSGPVAKRLDVPHISLYKDGKISRESLGIREINVIHVADLMTTGSSAYDITKHPPTGWIPMLRENKYFSATIEHMFNVVTRQQGGEDALAKAGVQPHHIVAIDDVFLKAYSNNVDRALKYNENPQLWSENYLEQNGALSLLSTFNPENKKNIPRIVNFLDRYEVTLHKAGKLKELNQAVQKEYDVRLDQLLGMR